MRKQILALIFATLIPAIAWGQANPVYDQASDINTAKTHFHKNLSSADSDVQKALETIDGLTLGGAIYSDSPLSGAGTSADHLKFTNPGYIDSSYYGSGTGVSIGTGTPHLIINTAPDQTVTIGTTGSGLTVTGTYPNFTLQNTAPATVSGWSQNGTNVYTTTSSNNVGIGTTGPAARLDLVGSGTTSATSSLVIRNSANAAKVTVLDNGNVGVGTTAPVGKLQVYNSSTNYLLFNANTLTIKNDDNSNPPSVRLDDGAGTGLAYLDFYTYTSIGQTVPTARWRAQDRNSFTGQQIFSVAGYGSANQPLVDVMSVGNNGTDGGGNHLGVSILTTYPKSSLDVNGNVAIGSYAGANAAPSNGLIISGNVGIGTTAPRGRLDTGTGLIYGDGSQLINLPASASGWTASGSNVYLTSSANNVGLGSASPTQKLQVVGNVLATEFDGATFSLSKDTTKLTTASDGGYAFELQSVQRDVAGLGGNSIALFGDSIIYGADSTNPPSYYLEAMLDPYSNIGVLNAGHSGDTAANLVTRITDVTGSGAKYVFVSIGINDITGGTSTSSYYASINSIIDSIQAAGQIPILGTILQWNSSNATQARLIDTWNAGLKDIAFQQGIILLDSNFLFGVYRAGGDAGNLWDKLAAYSSTPLHLNAAGETRYAHLMSSAMSQIVLMADTRIYNLTSSRFSSDNALINRTLLVSGNVGVGSTSPAGNIDVGGGSICLGHSCQTSWPSGSWSSGSGTVYIPGSAPFDVSADQKQQFRMEDNAASTTVVDTMGLTNGASFRNTSLITSAGKVSNGFTFNGTSDYINTGRKPDKTKNFEIMFWYQAGSADQKSKTMYGEYTSATDNIYIHWLGVNGYLTASFGNSGDLATTYTCDTNWHHYRFSYVAATKTATLYVDQVSKGSITATTIDALSVNPYLGANNVSGAVSYPVSGVWDDFRYIERNITTGEYNTIYNAGAGAQDNTIAGGPTSNVGIGSTAPTQSLDVIGTVKATTFSGSGASLTSLPSQGWTSSGTTIYPTTSTQNIGIGTNAPTSNVRVDVHGIGTTSASMGLQIANSAGTANVSFLDNGNVGIGTTSPGALLDIQGSGTVLNVQTDSTFPVGRLIRTSAGNNTFNSTFYLVTDYPTGAASAGLGGGMVLGIRDSSTRGDTGLLGTVGAVRENGNSTGSLIFKTYSSGVAGEAMRILSTGNVGIGSTAPQQVLDVGGSITSTGIGTTTSGTILCVTATKKIGYCTGSLTNSICGTCN